MKQQTKQKETLKEKVIRVRNRLKFPLLLLIAIIPLLGLFHNYYSMAFPMMNLWDVFVEQVFGSFWVAIAFISLIFFIILMLGGISYYTVLIFMLYFLLAMSIGYGYPIIPAFIAIFGTMYAVYQAFKWWDNR